MTLSPWPPSPPPPSCLSLVALNDLKHAVIGNPACKADVLSDPALVDSLVGLAAPREDVSDEHRSSWLEAVIIVGSLAHAGKAAIPTLLTLPALLPNLLSSLHDALRPPASSAAGPSSNTASRTAAQQKVLTVVLQALANVVGAMGRWAERERWGTGLLEDDEEGSDVNPDEQERAWREAVGQRVGEFLQVPTPAVLLALLFFSSNLTPRARLPLMQLLTSLASFSAQTRQALLDARSPRPALDKGKGRGEPMGAPGGGEGRPWIVDEVNALVAQAWAAAYQSKGGIAVKIAQAALELKANLEILMSGSERLAVDSGHHALEALTSDDEGIRFGAVCVRALPLRPANCQPVIETEALVLAAILRFWADIPLDSPPLSTAPGAARYPAETQDGPPKPLREVQIRAAFLLPRVIKDSLPLQLLAVEMGIVRRLGELLKLGSGDEVEWTDNLKAAQDGNDELGLLEMGEVDRQGHARLREGILLSFATIALASTRHHSTILALPSILKTLFHSLAHPTPAVRAAACQLVRGLSRNVTVLRETLVDSGIGGRLMEILQGKRGKGGKERDEVLSGALAAVANLVLEFSPLKEDLVNAGILPLVIGYAQAPFSDEVRLYALCVLKNFAYRALEKHRLLLRKSLGDSFRMFFQSDIMVPDQASLERAGEIAGMYLNILLGSSGQPRTDFYRPILDFVHALPKFVVQRWEDDKALAERVFNTLLDLALCVHESLATRGPDAAKRHEARMVFLSVVTEALGTPSPEILLRAARITDDQIEELATNPSLGIEFNQVVREDVLGRAIRGVLCVQGGPATPQQQHPPRVSLPVECVLHLRTALERIEMWRPVAVNGRSADEMDIEEEARVAGAPSPEL